MAKRRTFLKSFLEKYLNLPLTMVFSPTEIVSQYLPTTSLTSSVTFSAYLPTMDDFLIEPDIGQCATLEVNDTGDNIYSAFDHGHHTFIGDMRVEILEYEFLKPLGYTPGHRAKIVVRRVW